MQAWDAGVRVVDDDVEGPYVTSGEESSGEEHDFETNSRRGAQEASASPASGVPSSSSSMSTARSAPTPASASSSAHVRASRVGAIGEVENQESAVTLISQGTARIGSTSSAMSRAGRPSGSMDRTAAANAAWSKFFSSRLAADVPDFRAFAEEAEVNTRWIRKLKGGRPMGRLHLVMKAVQSLFVHKMAFKVSVRSVPQAIDRLVEFATNAPSIIAEQDRFKEQARGQKRRRRHATSGNANNAANDQQHHGRGAGKSVRGGAGTKSNASGSFSGPIEKRGRLDYQALSAAFGEAIAQKTSPAQQALEDEKARAKIAMLRATARQREAQARLVSTQAEIAELKGTADLMKSLNMPIPADFQERLSQKLSDLLNRSASRASAAGNSPPRQLDNHPHVDQDEHERGVDEEDADDENHIHQDDDART